jgi:hypothetical protein
MLPNGNGNTACVEYILRSLLTKHLKLISLRRICMCVNGIVDALSQKAKITAI